MMQLGFQINGYLVVGFGFRESAQLSKTVGQIPVERRRTSSYIDRSLIARFGMDILAFQCGNQARMLP
jgi:hypothetical protein